MQRTLTFEVKGNKYPVTFPTVAQFIDIETMKSRLANDSYGTMVKTGTILAVRALDYIDMVANVSVMCPDLLKDLKTNNLLQLDIFDAKELLNSYKKQFVPWLISWQQVLAELEPEKEEEPKDEVITEQDEEDALKLVQEKK